MKQDRLYQCSLLISFFMVFLGGLLLGSFLYMKLSAKDREKEDQTLLQQQIPSEKMNHPQEANETKSDLIEAASGRLYSDGKFGSDCEKESAFDADGEKLLPSTDEELLAVTGEAEVAHRYYVVATEQYLEIYQEGQVTPFLLTGIALEQLPETMQIKVLQGQLILNDRELFDFLENYTS